MTTSYTDIYDRDRTYTIRLEEETWYTTVSYYGRGNGLHEFFRECKTFKLHRDKMRYRYLRANTSKAGNGQTSSDCVEYTYTESFLKAITYVNSRYEDVGRGKCIRMVKHLAHAHGVWGGEWYWSVNSQYLDELWERIVRKVISGDIDAHSVAVELAPLYHGTLPTLSVCNDDINTTQEVFMISKSIRSLGVEADMFYRPLFYNLINKKKADVGRYIYKDAANKGANNGKQWCISQDSQIIWTYDHAFPSCEHKLQSLHCNCPYTCYFHEYEDKYVNAPSDDVYDECKEDYYDSDTESYISQRTSPLRTLRKQYT